MPLTEQQQRFFDKYIKSTGFFTRNKDDKNAERLRAYEAYLQLKSNLLEGVAGLPETVASKAGSLKTQIEGVDAMVEDVDSLNNAFKDLKLLEPKLKQIMQEAERLAREGTPEGHVRLLVEKARQDLVAVAEEDRREYSDLAETLREAFPDNPKIGLPEAGEYESGVTQAVHALRAIVGIAKDDVEMAERMIDEVMRGWNDKRSELIRKRDELKTDESKLEASVEQAKAREEFSSTLQTADAIVNQLEDWDSDEALAQRGEQKRLEAFLGKHDADFITLKSEADTHLRNAEQARNRHETKYATAVADYKKRIVELANGGKALNQKKLKKEQVAQLVALIGQCNATVNTGCNLAATEPMEALLVEAELLLHDLQNAEVMNGAIEKNISEIEKLISKNLGSKCIRQTDRTTHQTAITEFKSEWVNMTFTNANDRVLKIKLAVRKSIEEETAQQAWRKGILAEIKTERGQLKALNRAFGAYYKAKKGGGKKPDYEGRLKTEIDTCETWATTKEHRTFESTTEAKLHAARDEIAALILAFEDTTANATALDKLVEDHDATQEAKTEAEQDRQRFKTEISNFEQTIKLLQKEYPAMKTHPDELQLVKNILKQAKDQSKKGGDLANGRRLLKSAGDQLMDLTKRPAKLDRKSLGEIGSKWSTAYGLFDEKISALNSAVTDGAETGNDDHSRRAKALADQLKAVKGQMKADAFNKVADKLGNADLPEGNRKAAREQALALVRSYSDIVRGDALMKMCVLNPFGVKAFAGAMHKTLREIELEVLRGV